MTVNDADTVHRVNQSLINLADLHGVIFATDAERIDFVSHFIQRLTILFQQKLLPPLSSLTAYLPYCRIENASFQLELCQMIRRLTANFKLHILSRVSGYVEFLSHVATLTRTSMIAAVKEDDDTWNMEIFDELLEMWTMLCRTFNNFSEPF